jgi:hypothetical protein
MTKKYLKITKPTPILNTANFQQIFGGKDKKNLLVDEQGHIRALEFIALKDMIFEIVNKTSYRFIYEVKCNFYDKPNLYIDSRFAKKINYYITKPKNLNLSSHEIIKRLNSLLGTKYLWGGNWSKGIIDLLKYYPISNSNKELTDKWQLKGIDCSGFLFEVTNGFTPRNTSELMNYKIPIKIEGLSIKQIIQIIKPLDLILYQGHMIIILDNDFTIESRENFGVVKVPILDRLKELLVSKKPSNTYKNSTNFVIRRWFSTF